MRVDVLEKREIFFLLQLSLSAHCCFS